MAPTMMIEAGLSKDVVMGQTNHKSEASLKSYLDDSPASRQSVATAIGGKRGRSEIINVDDKAEEAPEAPLKRLHTESTEEVKNVSAETVALDTSDLLRSFIVNSGSNVSISIGTVKIKCAK